MSMMGGLTGNNISTLMQQPMHKRRKEYLLHLTVHWVQINIPSSIRMHVQAVFNQIKPGSSKADTITEQTAKECRLSTSKQGSASSKKQADFKDQVLTIPMTLHDE